MVKRTSYNVSFVLRKNKRLRNDEIPLVVRITLNGSRAEFNARFSVKPESWWSNHLLPTFFLHSYTQSESVRIKKTTFNYPLTRFLLAIILQFLLITSKKKIRTFTNTR